MVVCKYFMEGYCKFGVRCKFDHADPYRGYDSSRGADYSSERPQGTSILKAATSSFGAQDYSHSPQQSFGQPQQHSFSQHNYSQTPQHSFNQTPPHGFSTPPQQSSFAQKASGLKYNIQEIMQVVVRDITQLEKGGQWQLSCYSPLKELPNMPGLEDYSPEELRWECYKALQNSSLPLCQAIVQQLFGNAAKINNELKRKDSGYSMIDRWLRDSDQQSVQSTEQPASAFASPFGGNVSGSAFGSPFFSSEAKVQQSAQPVASSFSFMLPQQQQLSTTQPFQQNSSLFSNIQTTSASMFGSSQTTSPSASVFGTNQSTSPSASVFGNNQSTSPSASVFGNNQSTSPSASVFGNNQTTSPSASVFGTNQTSSSLFSNNQTSPSVFSSNQMTSAFAGQHASPLTSSRTPVGDSQMYSANDVLTEAELKAFQSDRFVLGSIPTKPPPRALCTL